MIIGTGMAVFLIRFALQVMSLPQLLRWLTCNPVAGEPVQETMEDVVYYVDRWLALFPYNPKGNCFPRALTLYRFARRCGLAVQFRCGVMKLNQRLEGHAWLMLDGRDFMEPSRYWQFFTVTVAFPPAPLPDPGQPSDFP